MSLYITSWLKNIVFDINIDFARLVFVLSFTFNLSELSWKICRAQGSTFLLCLLIPEILTYFCAMALLIALTSNIAYLVMRGVQNYSGFVALDIGFLQHICWGIHKFTWKNGCKMSAHLFVIPLSLKPWHLQFCETHQFFYVFI